MTQDGQCDGDAHGPLAGFTIVEMEGVGPGPFAAMWLADMGATVVRVSRPGQRPNQTRRDVLNRGRRSLAVDLKKPGAREIVLRLVDRADALIEGFRPGVMERLGLGPDVCLARRPCLVYGRITGWGQSGPYADLAGHDLNYLALTGLLHTIGPADGRPVPPLNLVGDFGGGGMLLVAGMLAALLEAGRSGRGQVVDAAMVDGASLLGAMIWAYRGKGQWRDEREANLFDGGAPFYGAHGGIPDEPVLAARDDRARWPEVRARLADIFVTRTRDEWCTVFAGTDACVTPVLTMDEAPHDPAAHVRGAFVDVAGVVQPAPAPRFTRTPGRVATPPPTVGEHSCAVLRDYGFSESEIAAALAAGTVAQS